MPAIIVLLLAALVIWLWNPFERFGDAVVVYPASCFGAERILPTAVPGYSYEDFIRNRDNCEIVPGAKRKYIIRPELAEVHYQLEGFAPAKHVNCSIIDSRNWLCEYPDFHTGIYDTYPHSGKIQMRNRKLAIDWEEALQDRSRHMEFYMSRWQWLLAQYKGQLFGEDLNRFLISKQTLSSI